MKDLMVDIEALGGTPDGVIASIGLCWFDPVAGKVGAPVTLSVQIPGQEEWGRRLDPATVAWWLSQSKEAIEATFNIGPRLSLSEALERLTMYVETAKRVWAKGIDFDLRMLDMAIRDVFPGEGGIPYWKWRDCRAIYDLAKAQKANFPQRTGEKHVAGEDAKYQAEVVVHAFREGTK
jgi:hypothetical protein